MNLTRRDALKVITLALVAGCGTGGGTSPSDDDRETLRRWMRVLIPDDDQGPGVDCPEAWALLEPRLEDPATRDWLARGWARELPDPDTLGDDELEDWVENDEFLARLHRLLVECYYGSAAGWRDLGLDAPPQPRGFDMPS